MIDWSDDDRLWAAMAPALTVPERFALAEKDAIAIAATAALPPRARVLDLGCGAGVHAIAFARLGYVVTGVDLSPSLLAHAKDAAAARGLSVEFIRTDCANSSIPLLTI